MVYFKLLGLLFFIVIKGIIAQQYAFSEHKVHNMTWCAKSLQEMYKCQNFTIQLERDRQLFDEKFVNVSCYRGYSADDCIQLLHNDVAHITTLDAGDVFTAGRFNSLVPIMQEKLEGGFTNYYAVAVVKKNTLPDVTSLRNLRNKKACFSWVGSLAGWTLPIYTLEQEGGMEIVDCNNQVKTVAAFFNSSCAVNSLIDKYNPIGDNSDKLCNLCTGEIPNGRCTRSDPYYGYDGAFRCLMEVGDVAFLKHSTVNEMIADNEFKSVSVDRFELLCKNGQRAPISEYLQCNWGSVPTDALVTSSARTPTERKVYQKFLQKVVELYSHTKVSTDSVNSTSSFNRNGFEDNRFNNNDGLNNRDNFYNRNRDQNRNFDNNPFNNRYRRQTNYNSFGRIDSSFTTAPTILNDTQVYEKFDIFESKRHKKLNLLFQDSTRSLHSVPENDQKFKEYLGDAMNFIYGIRECPVGRMSLCVTSDVEYNKCAKMRTALKAQLLKPDLVCYKAHSHVHCMQAISSGRADVAVLDAGDVYTAGWSYNLIPFMSEVYNLGEPEYYVVAVGKEEDPATELTYLKGKSTCHTGINTAAGWTYPLAYLISNGWIRPYGCDSVRAAAEYFTKSCIPGAISSEYNANVPYDSMCDLCHGSSFRYCRRDASEDYYGHTGAFRCLVEGGGDVAFVKHTTVWENTGGKRRDWWARNTLSDEFELLCPDGTRAELTEFQKCNLGKVKANAIVTRGGLGYNETYLNAYINLFQYSQQLYGKKYVDEFSFSMFSSDPPYYDLIFQDATRQLRVINAEERSFDTYLGSDFLRARRITDCYAFASKIQISLLTILILSSINIFWI